MNLPQLSHLSAVILPYYLRENSLEILLDKKTYSFPIVHIRGKLCPIGGNWIGKDATEDLNPQTTATRELNQEFTIEQHEELINLGHLNSDDFHNDAQSIDDIKQYITSNLIAHGDYINTIPKAVFDSDDPNNKREGFTYLNSYYSCQLDDTMWQELKRLMENYKNLSNESQSVILSYEEIINQRIYCAFGHDSFMEDFFANFSFDTTNFPMVSGIISQKNVHATFDDYASYLERYNVLRKPI